MIWRNRIPPTGRAKLNLEESQNKSACQKFEILLLPHHAMAENFGLVRKSMRPKLGRKSYFTPEGKVALMFLKIQQLQDVLAEEWKPYMQNLDTMYTDATCYESEMMYPTDLMNAPCRGAMMCD